MTHLTSFGPARRLIGLRDRMDRLYQDWPVSQGYSVANEDTLRGDGSLRWTSAKQRNVSKREEARPKVLKINVEE